jgi:preprotein translocase subunit SecA
MVQVSTGEGKSVILGIISTYLALVGFKVYEACYSNYLSERDYLDFENLFNLFGVKDKIFYRTFPEICRMML